MRVKEIEAMLLRMPGDQLLEELVTFTALHLDAHLNKEEDDSASIVRVLQARLAETGIAQKHHASACTFMLGAERCTCSNAAWSWPRKGLTR